MQSKIFMRIKCGNVRKGLHHAWQIVGTLWSYFLIFFFFHPVLNMCVFNSQVVLVLNKSNLYHAMNQYIPYLQFEYILSCKHWFLAKMAKMVPRGHFQQVVFLGLLFYCPQAEGMEGGQPEIGSRQRENPECSIHERSPFHTSWQGSLLTINKLNNNSIQPGDKEWCSWFAHQVITNNWPDISYAMWDYYLKFLLQEKDFFSL